MKKLLCLLIFFALLPIAMAQTVDRSVPSIVSPGQDVTITVTATSVSGSYFSIVRENIPSGWIYVSGGALEGNEIKMFISSISGNSVSYVLRSPDSESTSTFTGTYQFADDSTPITLANDVVQTTGTGGGNTGSGDSDDSGSSASPIIWIIIAAAAFFVFSQMNK
jgi:hypothetical protein